MAKVTLMDAGKTVEMEGKAVIAFVVNPADVKGGDGRLPDAVTLVIGSGQPKQILTTTAGCMGSLLTSMVEDPIDQLMLSMVMMKRFKDSIIGEGTEVEVQEKQVRPIKEED